MTSVLKGFQGAIKTLGNLLQPSPNDGRPLVSVVLGTYNRAGFLRKAIESVRQNGISVPYEIVVVDGGSSDGTIEWLVQQKDVITIVQHNRGEFRGRPVKRRSWGYFMNLAFKASQGRYVMMISDDCLLVPGAATHGVELFERLAAEGRKVGAVAFYFRNCPDEEDYYVQYTLGEKLMVNHGMYDRKALEEVGWADEETYIFYKADGDLCLRMWQAGLEVVDCPGAYVEHFAKANPDVRETNQAALTHDRQAYVQRWRGIYDMGPPDVHKRRFIRFEDPHRTADQFLTEARDAT